MQTIILTGASGHVCSSIVQQLVNYQEINLILVSRTPIQLSLKYPDLHVIGYDELETAAKSADLIVNLAVVNNDKNTSREHFFQINFEFVKELYETSKNANVELFCQMSTFKVLNKKDKSNYTQSKIAAENWLIENSKNQNSLPVKIMRLSPVYGNNNYRGKLELLMKLPSFIRPIILKFLSAFRPIASNKDVAEAIIKYIKSKNPELVFVSDRQSNNFFYSTGKFLIDYGFSISILLLLWWLLAIIFICIKLTSRGPGLFIQERVGKNGNVFKCYKFRTMTIGTPQGGTHTISQSAITPIGRVLRKSKLDELPQVINLFKFEMSLIGPRPCLPIQTKLIKERRARDVLDVLPGITGLSQVSGIDMSKPIQLARLDAEYIARRSLILDTKLILATFLGKGYGDHTKVKAIPKLK